MAGERIAARYAKSLLDLARDRGQLDSVKGDMDVFLEAVKNRDLYLMLKSPIVSADKKKGVLQAIFGEQFEALSMSFVNLLVDKGREEVLPEVVREFERQYRVENGISTVKLTTAQPLASGELEAIKAKLLASDSTEQSVEIETVVNPELIGGFVLEYNNQLYDASVAHKLDQYRKEFKNNAYTPALIARK